MAKLPPCMAACPIRTDARRYIQAIANGDFEEALRVIYEVNPIPGVCGRICSRPCENECRRGNIDEPLAIAHLKRFAFENAEVDLNPPPIKYREKVAVVGSGPAGLCCAYELRKLGYSVKIFEAQPFLGGMLRLGIPLYRLPRSLLDKELEKIKLFDIEMETEKKVNSALSIEKLLQEFQAVFLAVGASRSLSLRIEGEDLPGVYQGVDFLRRVNQGEKLDLGDEVVVVGGGNAAVDSARVARRLGQPKVTLLYRRSRNEMPAEPEEVNEAEEEGVEIRTLASPVKIWGKERVEAVECVEMVLGEPDESGRPRVRKKEGSNFKIPATSVIVAIGQVLEPSFSHGKIEIRKGLIQIDSQTMMTSWPGVFAGGDGVTGPSTVVEAMAQGRKAALSIHSFLRGIDLSSLLPPPHAAPPISFKVKERIDKLPRVKMPLLSPQERIKDFKQIEIGYSKEEAVKEAQRCLNCLASAEVNPELCLGCLTCVRVCPYGVPTLLESGVAYISPDDCQSCGLCVTECPAKAISLPSLPEEHFVREVKKFSQKNGGVVGVFCIYNSFASVSTLPGIGYPCLGKISLNSLVQSLSLDVKRILLVGCPPEKCHFKKGANRILNRVNYLKKLLPQMGLAEEKIELHFEDDSDGSFYLKRLEEIKGDSS